MPFSTSKASVFSLFLSSPSLNWHFSLSFGSLLPDLRADSFASFARRSCFRVRLHTRVCECVCLSLRSKPRNVAGTPGATLRQRQHHSWCVVCPIYASRLEGSEARLRRLDLPPYTPAPPSLHRHRSREAESRTPLTWRSRARSFIDRFRPLSNHARIFLYLAIPLFHTFASVVSPAYRPVPPSPRSLPSSIPRHRVAARRGQGYPVYCIAFQE
ncbi:hypothetical protein B0H11DRAFT_989537 [Mycena galericulata]|nr:hypothetical protein B0H11DRAFT_989537 [Mycena galericulata]